MAPAVQSETKPVPFLYSLECCEVLWREERKQMILGVDMGGTNTRIGLVSESFQLACPCRVVSSREFAWDPQPVRKLGRILMDYLTDCLVSLRREPEYAHSLVSMIAISAPASVSNDFCTIYQAPNLKDASGIPIFDGVALGSLLERETGIPVCVNKDVNYLLYYDRMKFQLGGTVVGCYIGTGFGSAVSIDGKMLYGAHGFAMDCGHLPLFHREELCGCGKQGCVETASSGIVLGRIREQYYPETPFAKLFTEHRREQPLTEFIQNCAYAPATLLSVFDPDALVLGGGVIEMENFPRDLLEQEILKLTERAIAEQKPKFCYAEHLPERGVIGAACFAAEIERERR